MNTKNTKNTNTQTHPSTHPARRLAHAAGVALLLGLAPLVLPACSEAEAADNDLGDLEARVEMLESKVDVFESKEEIRTLLLGFSQIVDNANVAALSDLEPRILPDFNMDVIDFDGGEFHFVGPKGLVEGFGPIMVSAQANLAPSAIAVEIDGDNATASFKFINSVKPPPELGLDVDEKVLLLAANTVTFVRVDGIWKLESLELIHSLAYPGVVAGIGG